MKKNFNLRFFEVTWKTQFFKLFFFFILSFLWMPKPAYCDENLLFSVDIIRHGDRNPNIEIPNAPYTWKGELGGLTEAGVQREKKLGSELRKEYVDQLKFLPEYYEGKTLYVRSTDFSRTKESARALLDGLYPLSKRNGIEIPIENKPKNEEDLLLIHPSNNPFSFIKMFFWKRNFWQSLEKEIREDLIYLRKITGLKLDTVEELADLADHLYICQLNQIKIPNGISNHLANKIITLSESSINSLFEQKEISGPSGTKLLQNIKHYFDQKINQTSELKYVLYMAHDSTIMGTLSALGAKVQHPHYASRLNFSLFKNSNSYQVRISQDGKRVDIPSCKTEACSYSQIFDQL